MPITRLGGERLGEKFEVMMKLAEDKRAEEGRVATVQDIHMRLEAGRA